MSSDPPITNREEKDRISRRDLGRYAALSAVAAAIAGKAHAQQAGGADTKKSVSIDEAMADTTGCRLFLNLIPNNMTISSLLYGPYGDVVDAIAAEADSLGHGALAVGLRKLRDHIRTVADGPHLAAWHLYVYDRTSDVTQLNPKWTRAYWHFAHADSEHADIAAKIRFPYLNLPGNTPNGPREKIADFLLAKKSGAGDYYFKEQVGHIVYKHLFTHPRDANEVCGPMSRPPVKTDPAWEKYRLIRKAFHLGIFESMAPHHSSQPLETNALVIPPNGECFSESLQECVEMPNKYCLAFAYTPTASSDICA